MQMMQNRATLFVVDTNALWWHLKAPHRLTSAANEVFQSAEDGNSILIVPAIVVAEFSFLSAKALEPLAASALFAILASGGWAQFSPLGQAQLEYLDRLPEIPEMHDRLIAAESIINSAPLLTSDRVLRDSPLVETVW